MLELQPQLVHWSLKYQGVELQNLLGFPADSGQGLALVRLWNDLPFTVFDIGRLRMGSS